MDAPESEASAAVDGDATLGSELGGTSFDELISQCAALKIVMEPSIPEELSAIKRKNAGRKRERQLENALRKRICYAIEKASASACEAAEREADHGADPEIDAEDEEFAQGMQFWAQLPLVDLYQDHSFSLQNFVKNKLPLRTEAQAISVLLYARRRIVRPLPVDGSAMRAIAAVLVDEQLSSLPPEDRRTVAQHMGISTDTALAARLGTTLQQVTKYRDLVLFEGGYAVPRDLRDRDLHFCNVGWGSITGPGLASNCPCPLCQRMFCRCVGRHVSWDTRPETCSCSCQVGHWPSKEAHHEHLRRMSSQPQTVEDFSFFVDLDELGYPFHPGTRSTKPSGYETPKDRLRRLMCLFRRVQKGVLTGPIQWVLPVLRERDDSPVPLYPSVQKFCLGGRLQRWGMQVPTAPSVLEAFPRLEEALFPGFLVLPLDVPPSAVEAVLAIWDGHGDASGPLRQAHRPILNADGSLSEFPFVLTWFPIPEWDNSESDEEGPSPADAESEEPESEPESEDDREIPDDEYW